MPPSPGHAAATPESAIRRLGRTDLDAFRAHLLRLDADSRRSRFAMPATDAFVTRYAAMAFDHGSALFGAFDDGRLHAAGELRPVSETAAEALFSVEPERRGRGVATALLARIIDDARVLGVRRIYMGCLSGNRAMQALARKFEAEFSFEPADLLQLEGAWTARERPAQTSEKHTEFATAMVRVKAGWRAFRPRRT